MSKMITMSKTNRSIALAASLGACGLGGNAANADEAGWYLGGGAGAVFAGYEVSDFDDGSITQGRVDDDDSAWKVFGGYRLNDYVAVEGGYTDLHNETDNEVTFSGVSDGTGANFALPGEVIVDIDNIAGVFAAVLGSYPLIEQFSINGKAGVYFWEAGETKPDLNAGSVDLDGSDPIIGIGAEYRFANGIAVRGELERYFDVARTDHDVVGVSVLYQF